MNETQLQALQALTGTTTATKKQESKTIDYKISVANKQGVIKAVGIVKLWKRFNETQMAQIVELLVGKSKRVSIEILTDEPVTTDDEF